jgi:peptide/nickel transport system permease protein
VRIEMPAEPPLSPPPSPEALPPAPKTLWQRVARDVVRRWGARVGMVWVAVLVICAVFAPLLANSHPLLMKVGGRWSSPMLRFLEPSDVDLLVIFAAAVVLYLAPRRVALRYKALALLGVVVVTVPLCQWLVRPPLVVVYEQYREQAAEGRVERAVYAPIHYSPSDRLRDQPQARLQAPSLAHPMGTTLNGADLLSNMIYACRIALSIGFISTGIAVFIGIVVGGIMGYYAGVADLIGMRLVEIFDSIPTLLLLLCFVAAFPPNLYIMMAIIGATSWVGYATFIRAEYLSLRQRDFVQAAIAAGLPVRSILFRHMLPNGITPVIISASFGVASAILAESTLSFLGIGLVEEASWGNLLNQATGVGGGFFWWIALYPGLAIFLTVFAYTLIGEALRDALDPKLSGIR